MASRDRRREVNENPWGLPSGPVQAVKRPVQGRNIAWGRPHADSPFSGRRAASRQGWQQLGKRPGREARPIRPVAAQQAAVARGRLVVRVAAGPYRTLSRLRGTFGWIRLNAIAKIMTAPVDPRRSIDSCKVWPGQREVPACPIAKLASTARIAAGLSSTLLDLIGQARNQRGQHWVDVARPRHRTCAAHAACIIPDTEPRRYALRP